MHDRCLFCHRSLGSNEALERFPVGSRLAFHAARGHLWVICPACRQWNLVPLELRWEVIEDCRRLYHDSTRVVATENIGLAQVAPDLELVAVGEPGRLEFAAWRYGSELTARWEARKRTMGVGLLSGGAAGVAMTAAALPIAGPALAATAGFVVGALTREAVVGLRGRRQVAAVPVERDRWIRIKARNLPDLRVEPSWTLRSWFLKVIGDGDGDPVAELHEVRPELGIPTLGLVMPTLNRFGGRSEDVEAAVRLVEEHEDPGRLVYAATKGLGHGRPHKVQEMPAVARLAIELATQEHTERLAARGELGLLERAWEEAQTLAEISDGLLEPGFVAAGMARLRRERR